MPLVAPQTSGHARRGSGVFCVKDAESFCTGKQCFLLLSSLRLALVASTQCTAGDFLSYVWMCGEYLEHGVRVNLRTIVMGGGFSAVPNKKVFESEWRSE